MSDQVDKKDVMVQILLAQLKDKHKVISIEEKEQQDKLLSEQKLKEEQSPWIKPLKTQQDQEKSVSQNGNLMKNKSISQKISTINQDKQMTDYTDVINGIARNFSSILQGMADQISINVGNQLKQEFYKQRQFLRQQEEKKINKSKRQKFQNQPHVEFMKPNLIQETLLKESQSPDQPPTQFQETQNRNQIKKSNEKFENHEKTLENNSKKKLQQSQYSQSYASQNQFEPYESENQKSSTFQKNESAVKVQKKNESEKQQLPNFEFFEDIDDLLQ